MKQGILTGNLLDIDKYIFLFKISYFCVLKIFLKKNNFLIFLLYFKLIVFGSFKLF